MKDLTDFEIENEDFLNEKGLDFVTVRMTENILSHSIFDATREMVKFLKENNIHDYSSQENGKKARVFVPTNLLLFNKVVRMESSLYKAGTRGDKRMWFGAEVLPYTDNDNIYAILTKNGELYIINISKIDLNLCFRSSYENPIKVFLRKRDED